MKVLYLIRSMPHFSYHESVIKHLCRNGHRVEVLFDREWSRHSSDKAVQACLATTKGLSWNWSLRRKDRWRWPLFTLREVQSYASYLNRADQSDYYRKRWEGYLPAPLRLAVKSERVRAFLAGEWAQSRLKAFEHSVPVDSVISQSLRENRLGVVVASPLNLRFSEEVEYVKGAKALGIPTVVPVISWDNLTTKGLFHVIPDLTLVWNRLQFNEAMQIHHVPSDKIVITGAPFFDKWFEASKLLMERRAFCEKVGLAPEKPFLVYLGSSANVAEDETWLVHELLARLCGHPDPDLRKMSLLVRPHPANAKIYKKLDGGQIVVWPKGGALPDSENLLQDFYNTLIHCVATVGINTSGMIDSVILDRPCVAIMTERYRATQLQAVHFRYLLDADIVDIAESGTECADVLKRLWARLDSKRAARRRFVREFIRPAGLKRPAGDVAALAIEMAALGKSAEQIQLAITSTNLNEQVDFSEARLPTT